MVRATVTSARASAEAARRQWRPGRLEVPHKVAELGDGHAPTARDVAHGEGPTPSAPSTSTCTSRMWPRRTERGARLPGTLIPAVQQQQVQQEQV